MLVDPVGAREAARLEYERTHPEETGGGASRDEDDYRREYRRTHVSGKGRELVGLRSTRAQEYTQRLAAQRADDYRRIINYS